MIVEEPDIHEDPVDPSATIAQNPVEDEYKVGPGHPPLETRYKKGCASPNPKGRRPKVVTLAPDLKKALEDALNTKVPVKKGEKQVLLSKAILGVEQLVNQFAKGDRHARRDLMVMASQLGVDLLAGNKEKIAETLSLSHQAILDNFISRQPRVAAPSPPRVIAPPELLDGITPHRRVTRKVSGPIRPSES